MTASTLPARWRSDLRDSWRALLKSPRHVATVVFCLGLGLTVSVTVFSFLTAFLYGDVPGVHERTSLARMFISYERATGTENMGRGIGRITAESMSVSDFESLARDPGPGLESVSAEGPQRVALTVGGSTLRQGSGQASTVIAAFTSPDYFRTLGTPASLGRMLGASDDRPDASPVLVVGYQLWRDHLGADEAIIGQPLTVGGLTFAVIGIAPPRFTGIKPTEDSSESPQIWIPLRHAATWVNATDPDRPWLDVVGRRHPSASMDDVRQGLLPAAARRAGERPDIRAGAEYLARRHGFGPEGTPWDLIILMAMLLSVPLTVLAIACANVANLQLARATSRTRELAVRQALGASRGQIVRLLSLEALLLAVAAAIVGCTGASAAIRFAQSWFPLIVSLDWRVLGFALVLVGGVTMLSGVAPAWIATRRNAAVGLRHSAQGGGLPHARLRHALVILQIAASFVLLAGSQLFVRLATTVRADVPQSVREQVVASFDLGMLGYGPAESARVMNALQVRLTTRPGVAAVMLERYSRGQVSTSASLEPGTMRTTGLKEVTPGYAAVTSARVLSGRWLEAEDSPRAVVVNERLARQIEDDGNVVGKQIVLLGTRNAQTGAANREALDIVGVLENQRRRVDEVIPEPMAYRLLPSALPAEFNLYVRTSAPEALAADLRGVLRDVDPRLPFTGLWLGADLYAGDFDGMKILALSVGGFGALALIVAAAGLYAVMTYIVSLRRREFGIRLAIGARGADLMSIVGRAALRLLVGGLIAGLLVTIPLAFVFRALLVGVNLDLLDPWAWTPVILALGAVTVLAAILPARRAATVNPIEVLRAE